MLFKNKSEISTFSYEQKLRLCRQQIHTERSIWVFFMQKKNDPELKHRDKAKNAKQRINMWVNPNAC